MRKPLWHKCSVALLSWTTLKGDGLFGAVKSSWPARVWFTTVLFQSFTGVIPSELCLYTVWCNHTKSSSKPSPVVIMLSPDSPPYKPAVWLQTAVLSSLFPSGWKKWRSEKKRRWICKQTSLKSIRGGVGTWASWVKLLQFTYFAFDSMTLWIRHGWAGYIFSVTTLIYKSNASELLSLWLKRH